MPVAANDHEANGLMDNAKITLRSFYNLLRFCDKRSSGGIICAEAIYGKNILVGSKASSAFKLLYGRQPRIPSLFCIENVSSIIIVNDAANTARRRMNQMLRAPLYKNDVLGIGTQSPFEETVRDGSPPPE